MIKFKQESFAGGMDMLSDETAIAPDAYRWMINCRQRLGNPKPTLKHVELEDAPAGLKQGIATLGEVLIVFVAGKAYYKLDSSSGWLEVADFLMSTTAARYWSITVPSSSLNLQRKASSTGNASASIIKSVDVRVAGTPAGVLVQDGINQPWIIFYDQDSGYLYGRETNTYLDWSDDGTEANSREYVPIGTFMMLQDDILFIVAADRKKIYRSVSGRPLDFMVIVDENGNKLASETQGGAEQVSFAFDYDDITNITSVNIPSSFIYGTANLVRVITIDYTRTIFGEPLFYVSAKIEAGIVNEDSVLENLGDVNFIDYENVKSFNAVEQLKVQGKNSIFSLQLATLVDGIVQLTPRCIAWDNYGLFDIQTKWGRACVVYDMLLQKWVAVDVTELDEVKQYTILTTETEKKLYAINTSDQLYQLFAGTTNTAQLMTKSWSVEDNESEIKSELAKLIFEAGLTNGTVRLTEFMNGETAQRDSHTLAAKVAGINYPVIPPVIPNNKQITNNESFDLSQGRLGTKVALHIQWDNDATLHEVQIRLSTETDEVAVDQKQRVISGETL